MTTLSSKHCSRLVEGSALGDGEVRQLMHEINDRWNFDIVNKTIQATFDFKNFFESMAFANAVAWIANREDHHPDLKIGYKYCHVTYTTHSAKGLTENDFICAAKIDELVSQ